VLCPRWFAAGAHAPVGPISDSLRESNADGPAVAYLAKFLAADLERCVLTGDTLIGDEDVQFVGICRVFSGTLRPGGRLYVMCEDSNDRTTQEQRMLQVQRVFLLKGRTLEAIPEARAGSIVAAQVERADVEDASVTASSELGVERYLTLCDRSDGPCLETPYSSQAFAIVRVSIQPQNVADLDALDRGLRLLHRADPSVHVEAMVTGENVLGCCGDEHLKRCITDLQKLYARGVSLSISTPLVAVREAVAASISADRIDPKNSALFLPSWASHIVDASTEASSQLSAPISEQDDPVDAGTTSHHERISMSSAGIMSVWTANRKACLRVSARALPQKVLDWMDENVEDLESVAHRQRVSLAFAGGREDVTLQTCLHEVARLLERRLQDVDEDAGSGAGSIPGFVCGISVAKGARAVLVDVSGSNWKLQDPCSASAFESAGDVEDESFVPLWMRSSVLAGFQLAAGAGPLCEEPLRGVALLLHGCQQVGVDEGGCGSAPPATVAAAEPYGPMSGQVMVAMKEACRYCLYRRGYTRICEAMLSLEVQSEQEVLGKVYGVLGKRRVKVLDEGLREGTSMFYISCLLPLADSFGLAQDLRSAASGHVSFHCAFSHWEQSEEDPFQEATLTAEELEELGDQALPPNNARKLIDTIRKRKGLPTDEKVVLFATKQRTVTKMK